MQKKVIITGGSGLIGSHLCQAFHQKGWAVVSFDKEDAPDGIESRHCDIGDRRSVADAFKALEWETLDLLINNAAAMNDFETGFADLDPKVWDKVIGTNLTGAYNMSRAAVRKMKKGSSIVNITSTRALMSEGGDFPYAASKGGIMSLTQAMAITLGPDIRVNAIAPGWITDDHDLRSVDHEQHPVGRVGRPSDIFDAVEYLLQAGFVTGETLTVDGGMTRKMIYAD